LGPVRGRCRNGGLPLFNLAVAAVMRADMRTANEQKEQSQGPEEIWFHFVGFF
jgi:hypothetical protein